jgi:hypothetical protein
LKEPEKMKRLKAVEKQEIEKLLKNDYMYKKKTGLRTHRIQLEESKTK